MNPLKRAAIVGIVFSAYCLHALTAENSECKARPQEKTVADYTIGFLSIIAAATPFSDVIAGIQDTVTLISREVDQTQVLIDACFTELKASLDNRLKKLDRNLAEFRDWDSMEKKLVDFKSIHNPLVNLKNSVKRMNETGVTSELKSDCEKHEPLKVLELVHDRVDEDLLTRITTGYKHSVREYDRLALYIHTTAHQLASVYALCLNLSEPVEMKTSPLNIVGARQAVDQTLEIDAILQEYRTKLMRTIEIALPSDIDEVLVDKSIENEGKSNKELANLLAERLESKYPFYCWLVVVYDEKTEHSLEPLVETKIEFSAATNASRGARVYSRNGRNVLVYNTNIDSNCRESNMNVEMVNEGAIDTENQNLRSKLDIAKNCILEQLRLPFMQRAMYCDAKNLKKAVHHLEMNCPAMKMAEEITFQLLFVAGEQNVAVSSSRIGNFLVMQEIWRVDPSNVRWRRHGMHPAMLGMMGTMCDKKLLHFILA